MNADDILATFIDAWCEEEIENDATGRAALVAGFLADHKGEVLAWLDEQGELEEIEDAAVRARRVVGDAVRRHEERFATEGYALARVMPARGKVFDQLDDLGMRAECTVEIEMFEYVDVPASFNDVGCIVALNDMDVDAAWLEWKRARK